MSRDDRLAELFLRTQELFRNAQEELNSAQELFNKAQEELRNARELFNKAQKLFCKTQERSSKPHPHYSPAPRFLLIPL